MKVGWLLCKGPGQCEHDTDPIWPLTSLACWEGSRCGSWGPASCRTSSRGQFVLNIIIVTDNWHYCDQEPHLQTLHWTLSQEQETRTWRASCTCSIFSLYLPTRMFYLLLRRLHGVFPYEIFENKTRKFLFAMYYINPLWILCFILENI